MRTVSIALFAAAVAVWCGSSDAFARVNVTETLNSPGVRARPGTLEVDPDTVADHLQWASWGGRSARATGTLVAYGRTERGSVTLVLSRPRRCGPYRLYTSGMLHEPGQHPFPVPIGCHPMAVSNPWASPGRWLFEIRPQMLTEGRWASDHLSHWRGWGSAVARAVGLHGQEGVTATPRVRVRLSRIRFCARFGSLMYTSVRRTLIGRHDRVRRRDLRPGCRRG